MNSQAIEWCAKKAVACKLGSAADFDLSRLKQQDWETLAAFCGTGTDWSILLQLKPEFAEKCPWQKFNGGNWVVLLCEEPQFADKCPWKKLDGGDWSWLLSGEPQFADECPWEEFNDEDWSNLLCIQPQFADRCDAWEQFDSSNWSWLLREQPQFADKCGCWEKFSDEDWRSLLQEQPQFAEKRNTVSGNDAYTAGAPLKVSLEQVKRQIRVIEECHRQNPLPKFVKLP